MEPKNKKSNATQGQSNLGRRHSIIGQRVKGLLKRRPHRSFKLSKRRDYKRSFELPGYLALTTKVFKIIKSNRRLFVGLALIYAVFALLLSSSISQETYSQLKGFIDQSRLEGDIGVVASNLSLLWGVIAGQLTGSVAGSAQQVIIPLVGLYAWLSTVWLLRGVLAQKNISLRDAIYSSGGPVIALAVLVLVLLIQLLPGAIAVIGYNAAASSGLLNQTVVLMLFGVGAIVLITLSLYWATSTVIAMIIATLPGMYPLRALRLAGDIVIGRRMRVLLRLLWLAFVLLVVWVVALVPAILLDSVIKSVIPAIIWLPIVPAAALVVTSFSIIFAASYTYIFYRKVVEDD